MRHQRDSDRGADHDIFAAQTKRGARSGNQILRHIVEFLMAAEARDEDGKLITSDAREHGIETLLQPGRDLVRSAGIDLAALTKYGIDSQRKALEQIIAQ